MGQHGDDSVREVRRSDDTAPVLAFALITIITIVALALINRRPAVVRRRFGVLAADAGGGSGGPDDRQGRGGVLPSRGGFLLGAGELRAAG